MLTTDDDTYEEPPMCGTTDEVLLMLKKSRANMLLMAIGALEAVPDQRSMEAGIECLRAALADLDTWAVGMGEMIERDMALSLGELRQH